jgi:hypothetical protein
MLKMQWVAIILMLVSHISIADEDNSNFIARNPGKCTYQNSTFLSQHSREIELYADLYSVPVLIAYQLIQIENIENLPKWGDCPVVKMKSSTASDLGLDITVPVQHIEGSIKYLSINYKKFNDWPQSLAGYHAGSNNKAVITKNWDVLPEETKKFVYSFGGNLIPVLTISQSNIPRFTTDGNGNLIPVPTISQSNILRFTTDGNGNLIPVSEEPKPEQQIKSTNQSNIPKFTRKPPPEVASNPEAASNIPEFTENPSPEANSSIPEFTRNKQPEVPNYRFIQNDLPLGVIISIVYLFLSNISIRFYGWVSNYVPFLPKVAPQVWWGLFIGIPCYFMVVNYIVPQV